MRNLYSTPTYKIFDQGMIFNCALASNYKGRKVLGIVITPRCDIAHKKNNEVHYLPVVSLIDWLAVDGKTLLLERSKASYFSKLKGELDKNKIDPSVLKNNGISELFKIIEKLIPLDAKRKTITECLKNLELIEKLNCITLSQREVQEFYRKEAKHIKAIVKELTENVKKDFYLIDPIDDKEYSSYYVVLNREIKRLDFAIAEKIHTGIFLSDIDKEKSNYCDIDYEDPDNFIFPISILRSPYMEHLIQQFISNFNRIGVTDHEDTLSETLTRKINYDEILIY